MTLTHRRSASASHPLGVARFRRNRSVFGCLEPIQEEGAGAAASPEVDRNIEALRRLAPDEKRQVREPLDREDRLRVQATDRLIDLSRELRWIEKHRSAYAGQWVAVRGDRLLSSGPDGRTVYEEARAAGDERPFVTRVEPADELPFAGW